MPRGEQTATAFIVAVESESTWWAFLPLRPPAPGWKECEGRYLWPADVHERAQLEARGASGEYGVVLKGPKEVVPRSAVLLDGVALRLCERGDLSHVTALPKDVVAAANEAFSAFTSSSRLETRTALAAPTGQTDARSVPAAHAPRKRQARPASTVGPIAARSSRVVPLSAPGPEAASSVPQLGRLMDEPPPRKLLRSEEGAVTSVSPSAKTAIGEGLHFELVDMKVAEEDLQTATRAVRDGSVTGMLAALGLYDRAINSASAKFGPAHVKIAPLLHWKALTLTRLATMLSTQRVQKLQEAVALYDLAVDIFARDKGPTDEKALISTLSKARALRLMGDAESANRGIQLLDTVIKVKASALGDAHVEVATLFVEKAGALTLVPERANLTEAVALCNNAIAALDSARQPAPSRNLLMSALRLKAHALLRLPSSQRAALEVYDRMIDTVGGSEPALLPLLRTKIELLEQVGELAAAAQLCDRVIHIASSISQPLIVLTYTSRRIALTQSLASTLALPAVVSS
jgi:hypothetical protein